MRYVDTKGLTLLEVIVAIGLIVAGLIGTLMLLSQATRDFRGADDRLIASQLAQEAIEVVINIRDTNWIEGEEWEQGLGPATNYVADYNSTALIKRSSSRWCLLRNAEGFYVHGTASTCNTPFSRHIEIENKTDGADNAYKEVRAVVSWVVAGGDTRSITIVDHLYDWR